MEAVREEDSRAVRAQPSSVTPLHNEPTFPTSSPRPSSSLHSSPSPSLLPLSLPPFISTAHFLSLARRLTCVCVCKLLGLERERQAETELLGARISKLERELEDWTKAAAAAAAAGRGEGGQDKTGRGGEREEEEVVTEVKTLREDLRHAKRREEELETERDMLLRRVQEGDTEPAVRERKEGEREGGGEEARERARRTVKSKEEGGGRGEESGKGKGEGEGEGEEMLEGKMKWMAAQMGRYANQVRQEAASAERRLKRVQRLQARNKALQTDLDQQRAALTLALSSLRPLAAAPETQDSAALLAAIAALEEAGAGRRGAESVDYSRWDQLETSDSASEARDPIPEPPPPGFLDRFLANSGIGSRTS